MNFIRLHTKLIVFSIIFALTSLDVYGAKQVACPAGQARNSQGKCVKKSRVTKAKENKKTLKSNPIRATNLTNNAINAYNKALTAKNPNTKTIQATQQAAIKAINNLISVYNQYLSIITSGQNAVAYVSQVFTPNNGMPTTSSLSSSTNGTMSNSMNSMNSTDDSMDYSGDSSYVSSCDDGSSAMCDDGTAINTLSCDDGSMPDSNGMCADGSLVICPQSGNNPICSDGTTPW